MLQITILCAGKLKESYLRDAAGEYAKRLRPFCTLRTVEISEARLPDHPSPAQIETALHAEAEAMLTRIPAGAYSVALCIEGQPLGSEQFAENLSEIPISGFSKVVFLIGSSYGLSPHIKSTAHLKLSLSSMTFPHQLVRVLLLEQIYRAFQIIGKGKYHK